MLLVRRFDLTVVADRVECVVVENGHEVSSALDPGTAKSPRGGAST